MSVQQNNNKKNNNIITFSCYQNGHHKLSSERVNNKHGIPHKERKKGTNNNILSPAQLFSFVGMLVGVVCHWKVGNYVKEGGEVWVETVCHIYIYRKSIQNLHLSDFICCLLEFTLSTTHQSWDKILQII